MAGETTDGAEEAQALWDEVAKERDEAGTAALATTQEPTPAAAETEAVEETTAAAEETAQAATDPAADTKVETPDPFAGLSPELKARLEKLDALEQSVAQIPTLVQNVKTAEGRVAAMQRELDQAKNAANAVGNAPTAAQIAAAKQSTEKWDSLKDDFPEWAEATEQFVKASLAGLTQQQVQQLDPDKIDAMVERRVAQVRAEAAKAVEVAKVEAKYEDWQTIVNSPEFVQWHGAQTPEVKALASSDRGRDAVRMLDLFAAAKAKPADALAAERAAKLAAAASKKPTAQAASSSKSLEDMSPEELWEYERKRNAKKGAATNLHY